MRIEKLEVSGLRSHRGNPPTTLELTGKHLVAVVGHTGAGKSSLLEAITFALFGEATYGGKAYEELSSDGRTEMTVQLTFARGDERYQLLRTVAPNRNGKFGNKVVYLRQVDEDGGTLSHTEGVREVDRKVSGLLGGMTREQFCQAVLLAQNRFADLLEANSADRERLLDTLLGLSALSEARTALQKTRTAAARNIERLTYQRSALPVDPAAEARTAKMRAKAMGGIAKRAEESGSKLDTLAKEANGFSQRATDLERAASLRTTGRGPTGLERLVEITATVEVLAQLEEELSIAEKQASFGLEDAQKVRDHAAEAVTRAEAEHGTAGRHQVVAQQLDTLAGLLREKPELLKAVSAAGADVQRLGKEKTEAEEKATAAKVETARCQQAEIEAQGAAQQAAQACERAEQSLASASTAVGRLSAQVVTAKQASGKLDSARSEVATIEAALTSLVAFQTQAQEALQAAIRSDSAAEASHGCHPGDDCPVCGRRLPDSWTAPVAGDLDAAHKSAAEAEAAVRKAADRQRQAGDAVVAARTSLSSALTAVTVSYDDISTIATLRELATPPAPAGSLQPGEGEGDEALGAAAKAAEDVADALAEWVEELGRCLAPLQEARKQADARLKEGNDQLLLAASADSAASTALGHATTALARAEGNQKGAVAAVEACEARLSSTLLSIDERWQALVDLAASDPLGTAQRTLADDESAVAAAVQGHKDAQSALDTQERQVRDLATRRDRELTAPLNGARSDIRSLAELVNDLCEHLELPGASVVTTDAGAGEVHAAISELADVIDCSVAAARQRCDEFRRKVEELVVPAAEVVSELVTLMADADPDGTSLRVVLDPEDPLSDGTRQLVQRLIGGAKQLAAESFTQSESAEKAVKTANELDERLAALGTWAADLDGAIEVLKKERFPRWARELKMADLVETASEHLSEMTDSRFRFEPSLQISDEVAGVVRKASTLSGGEKFEASLALALGVSEIAGRSGVRIETLFLDEGFAGLDQAHLNRALDALEAEVAAGRSIILITHIGAVADRIHDVLLIQPDGAGGSATRWLNEDERFELGADLDLAVP